MSKIEDDCGVVRTFLVPVEFTMCGQFLVRARTLKQAIAAVEDDDARFGTEAAKAEYVDDSFQINKDVICVVTDEERDRHYKDDTFVDLTLNDV